MSDLVMRSVNLVHNTIEQLRVDVDDMGHVELIDAMILPPLTKVDTTARVSMAGDAQPRTDDERAKLATYLAQHHHMSPFRHSVVTLCVECRSSWHGSGTSTSSERSTPSKTPHGTRCLCATW